MKIKINGTAASADPGRRRGRSGRPGRPGRASTARPRAESPFTALAHRPYRWWFFSQITSASGLMTQAVATSWLVLQMTGSAFDLALLSSATLLPILLGGMWAGALVDRVDRRRLLIVTQSALAVLSAALFVLISTGAAHYWSIVVLSAAAGMINTADAPARQVFVLDLVGRERLTSAVSLYEVILNTSRVLGPGLGGILLAYLGPSACVLANSISFLAPLAVLLRMRTRIQAAEPHSSAEPGDRRRGAARAGLRYAWSVPVIRACLLIAAASGILFNSTILFPLLADRVFHLGAGGYGALMAAFGVGAMPGALLAARGHGEPSGRLVGLLAAATGLCMATTALAPDVALLYVGMGSVGLTSIWMIARANTLVQLRSAPELRGRVMGAWTVALPGTSPVTGLAVGALADAAGARVAFAAAGLLIVAISAYGWRGLSTPSAAPIPALIPAPIPALIPSRPSAPSGSAALSAFPSVSASASVPGSASVSVSASADPAAGHR